MKLYSAVTGLREPIYLPENGITNLLMSYHYYEKNIDLIKNLISANNDIFIDSGAFSAYNAGKKININNYCKFLIKTGSINYAGLDVVGDAAATMKNQIYMEQEYGLCPIPTFHMGEELIYAQRMAEKYEYIAIGGMVFSEGIKKWLDILYNALIKINPNIKCHGFGMTNTDIMMYFPWYSVDSSSFKSGRRFGRLILYDEIYNTLKTYNYDKWCHKYASINGHKILTNNKLKYEITDVESAKSYNKFVDFINNNPKNLTHIGSQQTLF